MPSDVMSIDSAEPGPSKHDRSGQPVTTGTNVDRNAIE